MGLDAGVTSAEYIQAIGPGAGNQSMIELQKNRSDFNEKNASTTTAEYRSRSLLEHNSQRQLILGEQSIKLPNV